MKLLLALTALLALACNGGDPTDKDCYWVQRGEISGYTRMTDTEAETLARLGWGMREVVDRECDLQHS